MDIFVIINIVLILVLIRLPFVANARLKRIDSAESVRDMAEFDSGPSFFTMMITLTKWKYNDFYPKDK